MFWKHDKFRSRCTQSIGSFGREIPTFGDNTKDGQRLFWKDNGSSVLAVAHLDSVQPHKNAPFKMKNGVVRCPTLDDRMGAHIILDVLPSIGITTDILLTEGEETGRSTAQFFDPPPKQYNWIVEFDRAGDDVVTYEFGDTEWDGLLRTEGFKVGWGSFTDICFLEDLGVKAFNIGVGYEEYHSKKAWADLDTAEAHIWMFAAFYHKWKDTKFPHEKKVYKSYNYGGYRGYRGGWADDYDYDDLWQASSVASRTVVGKWEKKRPGRYVLTGPKDETVSVTNPEMVNGVKWQKCAYCFDYWPDDKMVDSVDGEVCIDCAAHFLRYAIDTDRYEYETDVGRLSDGTYATLLYMRSNDFIKPADAAYYYHRSQLFQIDGTFYLNV